MAGIGWRLERLIDRDTLGGQLGAFLTGVAVTSGPWLLTTLVLVLMRISAVGAGVEGISDVEQVITIVYATVIVLSAPIDIVVSRYSSDRVYELRRDQIATPLRWMVRSHSNGPTSRSPKTGLHRSMPSGSTCTGLLVGWRSRLERYGG